jgi:hypothetical protein
LKKALYCWLKASLFGAVPLPVRSNPTPGAGELDGLLVPGALEDPGAAVEVDLPGHERCIGGEARDRAGRHVKRPRAGVEVDVERVAAEAQADLGVGRRLVGSEARCVGVGERVERREPRIAVERVCGRRVCLRRLAHGRRVCLRRLAHGRRVCLRRLAHGRRWQERHDRRHDRETDCGAWSAHRRRSLSQAPPASTADVSSTNEAGSGTATRPMTPPCTS